MGLRNRTFFTDKSCFFVTTTCFNHLHLLATKHRKQIIAESLNFIIHKYHIALLGYVIMPNHLHMILYFKSDSKLSDAMRDFKKFTATQIRKDIENNNDNELLKKIRYQSGKQIFKVWQDRFDDVWIENKKILETKLEYSHLNPLQKHWNLTDRPENYFYSSAAFYETDTKINPVVITDYRDYF